MARLFFTSLVTLFFSLFLFSSAEEKVERAWASDSQSVTEGPYVYCSFEVPEDILRRLIGYNDYAGADPFSNKKPIGHPSFNVEKIAPKIPSNTLPLCLPRGKSYRNMSEIVQRNGVAIKTPEWAVIGNHHNTGTRIYFCTTIQNADIIEQIFTALGLSQKATTSNLATLVSVDHKSLESPTWTVDNLSKLSPTIHSRHGITCRNGERTIIKYLSEKGTPSVYEIEPTVGEHNQLVDLRLSFAATLTKPKVQIDLFTAVTKTTEKPFIIDCGMHGKPLRNYLLILESPNQHTLETYDQSELLSLKKIKGIYAFRKASQDQKPRASKLITHSYHSTSRFLPRLRDELQSHEHQNQNADPFAPAEPEQRLPEPPARVKNLTNNKHHSSEDIVYNITPHFAFLGMPFFHGEEVHFNNTKSQIIITARAEAHDSIARYYHLIDPSPLMMKTQAQIVLVDRQDLTAPEWTLAKITSSNPKILKKYSSTLRSGEKATFGRIMDKFTHTDSKSGKKTHHSQHEFEADAILGQSKKFSSLRFSIHTPQLGEHKTAISLDTALTIKDGKPVIIELGHPNSSTHTHLLIMNVDVITTDGSFYRDLLKPLE